MAIEIRLATESDLPGLYAHFIRHGAESGKDGDFIFTPQEESQPTPLEDFTETAKKSYSKRISEVGWERCWVALSEGKIVGDLKLKHGIPLKACLHRALLQMGIEQSARGMGVGNRLMSVALDWARGSPNLDWVDLFVFSHNVPAIALYLKYGFKECGRIPDSFRISGQSIDDVSMVLSLRNF